MIVEIPCDIVRVSGLSWNHLNFDGCNWLFNEGDFPNPPQDPPNIPRAFNLNPGAKNVKVSIRNCTFIGDNQHDTTESSVYSLTGYANSIFVENCHHEAWGKCFNLTGFEVDPTFYQIGEIKGVGVSLSDSAKAFTFLEFAKEDWRGEVDISFYTQFGIQGATLMTAVRDPRHHGVLRSGGNLNLPASVAQVETFVTRADVGGDLDGKYFQLNDQDGSVGFWIDVDNSGTTIPAGAAALDRDVKITGVVTNDSATDVAVAVAAAIQGDSKYATATNAGNLVTVTHADSGEVAQGMDWDANFTLFLVSVTGTSGYKFSGFGNNPKWWRYKAHATGAKATGNSAYEFILAQ